MPLELTPSPLPSELFQAKVWDSLYSPSQSSPETPFSTLQWQSLWWRHFGQKYRWSAFTIRENGRVIGIAPFYWDPGTGFLKLIGGEDLSDYLDILAAKGRESQVWDQILGYLESSPQRSGDWTFIASPPPPLPFRCFLRWPRVEGIRSSAGQRRSAPPWSFQVPGTPISLF